MAPRPKKPKNVASRRIAEGEREAPAKKKRGTAQKEGIFDVGEDTPDLAAISLSTVFAASMKKYKEDGTFFVIRYEDDGKYQITDSNADKLQAFPKLETDIEGYYDYPFADGRVVLATWSDGKAYTAKIIAVQKDKVTAEANLAQAEKVAKLTKQITTGTKAQKKRAELSSGVPLMDTNDSSNARPSRPSSVERQSSVDKIDDSYDPFPSDILSSESDIAVSALNKLGPNRSPASAIAETSSTNTPDAKVTSRGRKTVSDVLLHRELIKKFLADKQVNCKTYQFPFEISTGKVKLVDSGTEPSLYIAKPWLDYLKQPSNRESNTKFLRDVLKRLFHTHSSNIALAVMTQRRIDKIDRYGGDCSFTEIVGEWFIQELKLFLDGLGIDTKGSWLKQTCNQWRIDLTSVTITKLQRAENTVDK